MINYIYWYKSLNKSDTHKKLKASSFYHPWFYKTDLHQSTEIDK